VARMTTSHSAACCFVPAMALGPRSETKSASVAGPLEFDTTYGVSSGYQVTPERACYGTGSYKSYFHDPPPISVGLAKEHALQIDCFNQPSFIRF